jgi:hypothetical protein
MKVMLIAIATVVNNSVIAYSHHVPAQWTSLPLCMLSLLYFIQLKLVLVYRLYYVDKLTHLIVLPLPNLFLSLPI